MLRKTEEINAGSMADIAFLLLIFFLVVTTIDTKKGIAQELPPNSEDGIIVHPRNILTILVNSKDELLVERKRIPISELAQLTREYLLNPNNKISLPERIEKNIPGLGDRIVSKQVISLQNDMGTTYGIYVQIHSILLATYRELRNEAAIREYGITYDKLKQKGERDKIKAIRELIPMIISEAPPITT